jgi:hypothetical protein
MPFILAEDRKLNAIDPDTNARMAIRKLPDGLREVRFGNPEMAIRFFLRVCSKFPGEPRDASNPDIMIAAGALNWILSYEPQFADYDFERKTSFAEYIIRMMAFINKHYPLGGVSLFWSDYADYASGRKGTGRPLAFRMPSDEELIKFSMEA